MEMSRERRNNKHFTGKAVTKGAATWLYGPRNDLITKKLVNESKSVFDYNIF